MITHSPVYKGIKTAFLYLAILVYFFSFLGPILLQIPQVDGFLTRTRLLDKLTGDGVWLTIGICGILFGLDKIIQGYQAVTTHFYGRHTGAKAELHGIFSILLGFGLIIFFLNLIFGWWGRLE